MRLLKCSLFTVNPPLPPFRKGGVGGFYLLFIVFILFMTALYSALSSAENNWRQRETAGEEVSKADITEEVIFGREVAARILGRYSLYDNSQLMKYVTLVGNAVALNTNRPEIEFHFAVLDTAEINAYAAPGGYVFVTRGALSQMKDESELAGVLAHEIAHITEKHIVKELNIRGTEDSPVSGLARAIGGAGYEAAKVAFFQAVDKALDVLFKNGYKREDEIQADKDAVVFCALTGYDPSALSRYLNRINGMKGKQTGVLDRTHPAYDTRLNWLKETISKEGMDIAGGKTNKERFTETMKGGK
ncbi:MAG: peptidase M48 Ste24p [Nitrospira sp.]|nr:peptidase M48 Ste24p [Nitrospira sp.]